MADDRPRIQIPNVCKGCRAVGMVALEATIVRGSVRLRWFVASAPSGGPPARKKSTCSTQVWAYRSASNNMQRSVGELHVLIADVVDSSRRPTISTRKEKVNRQSATIESRSPPVLWRCGSLSALTKIAAGHSSYRGRFGGVFHRKGV